MTCNYCLTVKKCLISQYEYNAIHMVSLRAYSNNSRDYAGTQF